MISIISIITWFSESELQCVDIIDLNEFEVFMLLHALSF
jgi:hypothetical protein